MQFASSGTLDQVQSYVASVIAQRGGTVIAASPSVMTARFTKKFSIVWCLLTVVIGYLIYWLITREQSLTVTYQVNPGIVAGRLQAKGARAKSAAKAIVRAFI